LNTCSALNSVATRTGKIFLQLRTFAGRGVAFMSVHRHRSHVLALLLAGVSTLGLGAGAARAQEAPARLTALGAQPSSEELIRRLQAMEQRIQSLEKQLKQKQQSAQAVTPPKGTAAPADSKPADAKPADAPPANSQQPPASATPVGKTQIDLARWAAAAPAPPSNLAPTPPAAGQQQPLLPPLPGEAPAANKPGDKPILGVLDSPVAGLSIGAYGEIKYGWHQNPAAGGQWQNGFDAHRLVLLPTYAIAPNIIFNAEIEFEHGGIAFDPDDKLRGSVDVEQVFVDFLILDQLNWRSPGIDLIPIGYINQHHEPTQFYSVNRPELYNGLIPSTWRAGATSFYGTIADGIKYQVQASTSLEDFGDDFGLRIEANTVPPGFYLPGIDGLNALAFSRPPVGDFRQLSNTVAYAAKLDFTPPFLPGLGWSMSAYYSPNTTPRGAHDEFGNLLGGSNLTMFDAEFRYRIPKTPVELRGEYVFVNFGNPANLRANNDGDPTNNVGKTMYGYSGEIAFHLPLGTILKTEWEAVPFYRYTYQNLQTAGFAGTDANLPTGAGQIHYHTLGLAVFPTPKIVLKATYQHIKNNDPLGALSDSFLGAIGFFF
jgi:hypothetical protein